MQDEKPHRLPYTTNLGFDLGLMAATNDAVFANDAEPHEKELLLEAVSAASDVLNLAAVCPRRECRKTLRCQPEFGSGKDSMCKAPTPGLWFLLLQSCLLFDCRGKAYRDAARDGQPVPVVYVDYAKVKDIVPRPMDLLRPLPGESAQFTAPKAKKSRA